MSRAEELAEAYYETCQRVRRDYHVTPLQPQAPHWRDLTVQWRTFLVAVMQEVLDTGMIT